MDSSGTTPFACIGGQQGREERAASGLFGAMTWRPGRSPPCHEVAWLEWMGWDAIPSRPSRVFSSERCMTGQTDGLAGSFGQPAWPGDAPDSLVSAAASSAQSRPAWVIANPSTWVPAYETIATWLQVTVELGAPLRRRATQTTRSGGEGPGGKGGGIHGDKRHVLTKDSAVCRGGERCWSEENTRIGIGCESKGTRGIRPGYLDKRLDRPDDKNKRLPHPLCRKTPSKKKKTPQSSRPSAAPNRGNPTKSQVPW
jgi:hypothetical protein